MTIQSFVFPGNIEESIMKIGSNPIPYMRTDFFSEINKESEKLLLKFVQCSKGKTIIYTEWI